MENAFKRPKKKTKYASINQRTMLRLYDRFNNFTSTFCRFFFPFLIISNRLFENLYCMLRLPYMKADLMKTKSKSLLRIKLLVSFFYCCRIIFAHSDHRIDAHERKEKEEQQQKQRRIFNGNNSFMISMNSSLVTRSHPLQQNE